MTCTSCNQPLPAGVGFCPNCGVPTPYNTAGSAPSSPYAPTIASSYGNPQNTPATPPTMAAGPYDYSAPEQNPYTNYGAGQQAPANQNYMPPPPPMNPSGPYYNAPPVPGYAPVSGMQPGVYNPAVVPPKKKSKVGLIVGLSLLGVVVLCGGLFAIGAIVGGKTSTKGTTTTNTTSNTDPTATAIPTTTVSSSVPTSADLVPAAQKILFGLQTSKAVDKDYAPTQPSATFAVGKDVNLTFQVDSAGKNGYIKAKWYEDGQEVDSEILQHHAENNQGFFPHTYTTAGKGAAALYWCATSTCSDEQAARVVYFTITDSGSTSAVPAPNTTAAIANRKQSA